jgi:hypothetical protein
MMRVLEIIVALIMVAILYLLVGVAMPDHGSTSRSVEVSHDFRQVYDILSNFRRFPDFGVLRAYDPNTQFTFAGPAYGVGAEVSWTSKDPKVGDGTLTITKDAPGASQVSTQGSAEIDWALSNGWDGHNKRIIVELERSGSNDRLVRVTMRYKVDYGWNLIDRYSRLYIHGEPAAFVQYTLGNLQNLLASIPNVSYNDLQPRIVESKPQPVLFVSTRAKRTLEDVSSATQKALTEIDAAMKKLGVTQAGPRITVTTDYGDQNYAFDIAVPINTSTLTVAGQSYDLTQPGTPDAAAAGNTAQPGTWEKNGALVVAGNVSARMAFAGKALEADMLASPASLPLMRLNLEAYAQTHGYAFDPNTHHPYDVVTKDVDPNTGMGSYAVYLPLSWAPDAVPGQSVQPAAAASAAPAAAASVAAGTSASAPAGSGSVMPATAATAG